MIERLANRGLSFEEQHSRADDLLERLLPGSVTNRQSTTSNPWFSRSTGPQNYDESFPRHFGSEQLSTEEESAPTSILSNNYGYDINLIEDTADGSLPDYVRSPRQNLRQYHRPAGSLDENFQQYRQHETRPREGVYRRDGVPNYAVDNRQAMPVYEDRHQPSSLRASQFHADFPQREDSKGSLQNTLSSSDVLQNIEEIVLSRSNASLRTPLRNFEDTTELNTSVQDRTLILDEVASRARSKKGGERSSSTSLIEDGNDGRETKQSRRKNRPRGERRGRKRNRNRKKNKKKRRKNRKRGRNKRNKLDEIIATESLILHEVDNQSFLDCCPSKLVVVEKQVGKARNKHAVEIHPDSQFFYERVCLEEFEGTECLFPSRAVKSWVQTRCAPTYSFSQVRLKNAAMPIKLTFLFTFIL